MARLLDPLALALLAIAVGLLLQARVNAPSPSRWARVGRVLVWAAWAFAYLLSMPVFSAVFVHHYEAVGPDLAKELGPGEHPDVALVVLSGSPRTNNGAFPFSERIDASSQARTLAAARFEKQYGFGVIVVTGAPPIMALGMDELLVRLGVPKEKIKEEIRATSTRENAEFCAAILRDMRIKKVVVVTSSLHLRRSVTFFERQGLEVLGAAADPQSFDNDARAFATDFLPSSDSMQASGMALHEVLGRIEQRFTR